MVTLWCHEDTVGGGGSSDPCCVIPPPHLEHLNFLGEDERWGPMAVSVRREERGLRVLHRVIVRTGQVGGAV